MNDPTYHCFLVNKCIYMLVVNMPDFTIESVEEWLQLLRSRYSPNPASLGLITTWG